MNFISNAVIEHKRMVITVFSAVAVLCAVFLLGVRVNYNMIDYLPKQERSTVALSVMEEEFTQAVPNARVMLKNVSIQEAVSYKQKLLDIDGVTEALWLDDIVDIHVPLEISGADVVEAYYKDKNALVSLTIEKGKELKASNAIRELIGEGNALAGEAPDIAAMQLTTGTEVVSAICVLVPAIIILLILSTSSWLEPFLFLFTIGISIVINMGSDLIFGEISFVTRSVSPILQLAVSLDYAIFLLHSFADYRKKSNSLNEAMALAMKRSLPAIAASATTTLFGFMALAFMKFEIGADLGINLVKGVLFSFVSVMLFLPALTLSASKLIDKTAHRPFMPSFKNVNGLFSKIRIPALLLVVLLIVPSFLGQGQTAFSYGNRNINPNDRSYQDTVAVNEVFGESTIVVLLVPRGDVAKEHIIGEELSKLENVTGVMSYAATVGNTIPNEFLDKSITEQFYSENYSRIIIYTNTANEGDTAFLAVEQIQDTARKYYGENFYTCGQSANLYDMKNVAAKDNSLVNLIAVISIFGVLLVTFKSLILPFMLLLTIEAGIWLNLSIPYFMGSSLNFIGYLVVSTVQLGATVDYAILLTDHYIANRKLMPAKEAVHQTLGETFKSILISASILSVAGFTLYVLSTNPIVCELGLLIGRGALLSMMMVLCVLPAMLIIFDKVISKTKYKANFYQTKKDMSI